MNDTTTFLLGIAYGTVYTWSITHSIMSKRHKERVQAIRDYVKIPDGEYRITMNDRTYGMIVGILAQQSDYDFVVRMRTAGGEDRKVSVRAEHATLSAERMLRHDNE